MTTKGNTTLEEIGSSIFKKKKQVGAEGGKDVRESRGEKGSGGSKRIKVELVAERDPDPELEKAGLG